MSLRLLAALLVGATVILIPAAQFVVVQWFAGEATMVAHPASPLDAKHGGTHSPPTNAYAQRGDEVIVTPIPDIHSEYAAAIAGRRQQILLVSIVGATVMAFIGMFVFAMVLRRPLALILDAISDIERGVTPQKLAFSGPTELRVIGSALVELGAQFHGSLRERDLMLASLTHDLRSPLARLRAALELRAYQAEDPQLSATLQEVDEIAHVISQCVDYARDGSDEPLVAQSLDRVASIVLQNHSDIVSDLSAPILFPMRELAIGRAIRNLIDNARRHGQPPIRITTSCDHNWVELRVEDGGHGIPSADWSTLAHPFTQGVAGRSRGGAGLGLTIVHRVVVAHDGEVQMRACDGQLPFCVFLRFPVQGRSANQTRSDA